MRISSSAAGAVALGMICGAGAAGLSACGAPSARPNEPSAAASTETPADGLGATTSAGGIAVSGDPEVDRIRAAHRCTPQGPGEDTACAARGADYRLEAETQCMGGTPKPPEMIAAARRAEEEGRLRCVCETDADRQAAERRCMMMP
ncbi:MAG TPA: hypothetical protein VL400_23015 [Polyangiaceae bacterium]|nr:hypothetical protein [Polyangiaceae bacterium]